MPKESCSTINCVFSIVKIEVSIGDDVVPKYFNSIQGWRIELLNYQEPVSNAYQDEGEASFIDEPDNDLPF